MIANRFRAVGWVAGVAAAALGCYLVSLQVASERGQLMKMERRILGTRADIRQLRTELGTRARLVQLERWNAEVLGLQAPQVSQYASGAVQLASYVPAKVPAVAIPAVTGPMMTGPSAAPAAMATVAYKAPRAAPARPVATASAPAQPLLRRATFQRMVGEPAPSMVRKTALVPAPLLAPAPLLPDDLLGDIGRRAAIEAKPRGR